MQQISFAEALEQILQEDARFDAEAYLFLKDALDHTVKMMGKPAHGPAKHVTGQELLNGIRGYALQEYGPMALRVLNTWGIRRTEDFGELVFNLIGKGIFGKTATDRKEDFANGYDFFEALAKPFLPASRPQPQNGDSHAACPKKEQTALGNG